MPRTQWPDVSTIGGITPHQREQLAAAFREPVGLLLGSPGTGKTYTFGRAARVISDGIGPDSIAACAPTGKAAQRMTVSLAKAGVDVQATTIHRLLGVMRNGHDGKGWGFFHDEKNPLTQRVLFVDEASMLDTDLAASLLRACSPSTHVLFVGDIHQLPPVGHGSPLRDMKAAGISTGELTEIIRNDGAIVRACRDIKEGRPPQPSDHINTETGHNWKHCETPMAATSVAQLKQLLDTMPAPHNPIWSVQVLCAINEKGELNRKFLNEQLQSWLNPHGRTHAKCKFRVADKVICVSNGYHDLYVEQYLPGEEFDPSDSGDGIEKPETFVANGELGRVTDVTEKHFVLEFDLPKRRIRVANASGKKSDSGDSGKGGANDFDLGYAITTHKSQGSQAPIVIPMIDEHANFVSSREFWYTAMSRPETLLITIGRLGTLHRQCKRQVLSLRKTMLAELLKGGA